MSMKKRNVWILGATGYIGNALVRHLAKDHQNSLHILFHKQGNRRYLEQFNTFSGSLNSFDFEWFKRYPPDVIFHLARPAGSNFITRKIKSYFGEKANQRWVNALSTLSNPPIVVYVSGSLMYGKRSKENPADENAQLKPDAFAKYYIRNEQPWIEAQLLGKLDVRFARPGWIVGTQSWFYRFFWKHFLETGKVPCYGNHPMSLVHVDDCAAMIDALSLHGPKGQNLNIFSGHIIGHEKFCQTLAGILNTEIEFIPREKVKSAYGKATADALVSSTPMTTLHPEVQGKANIKFQDCKQILQDVVLKLKEV
jgi:nucleoside-diphosphate-sugar epimerase